MTTMKGTEHFKQAIKAYLDKQAETDPLFAPHYSKPEKSIDKCVEYIIGEVFHSGCNGFDDQSVYGWAIHYYTEDNVKIREIPNNGTCHAVVNHAIELTEEEKAEARQRAISQYQAEESQRQSHKKPNKLNLTYSAFEDETTQQIRESGACPKQQAPPLDKGAAEMGVP